MGGRRAHIHRANVLSWPGLVTVQVEPIALRALSKVAEPRAKLPRGSIDILQAQATIFSSALPLPEATDTTPKLLAPRVQHSSGGGQEGAARCTGHQAETNTVHPHPAQGVGAP